MRNRSLASMGAVRAIIAIGLLASAAAVGQVPAAAKAKTVTAAKPGRTPDGQPDLQGVWVNKSATPFERPKSLEGRPFLTDDEAAELRRRADRLFKDGNARL